MRGAVEDPAPLGMRRDGFASRLTLLVENRTGYKNLCRLITAGALGKPKGETAVTLEQVAAHAEGLHATTGGDESPVARAFREGGLDAARGLLERLAGIFPAGCTSSCSGTICATRSGATRRFSIWREACGFRSSPRTASATRARRTRSSTT